MLGIIKVFCLKQRLLQHLWNWGRLTQWPTKSLQERPARISDLSHSSQGHCHCHACYPRAPLCVSGGLPGLSLRSHWTDLSIKPSDNFPEFRVLCGFRYQYELHCVGSKNWKCSLRKKIQEKNNMSMFKISPNLHKYNIFSRSCCSLGSKWGEKKKTLLMFYTW